MFELNNNVALVLGGRGYLGRSFCQSLYEQGATVISADLDKESKAASTSVFKDDLMKIKQLDVDVTNKDSVIELVSSVLKEYGRIDTLIYSVTAKPDDFYLPFTECSLEGWQSVIKSELDGLFLVTQLVGRSMEQTEKGNIIFISSIYGVVGNDQRLYKGSNLDELYSGNNEGKKYSQPYSHSVYPVVKGGVISLTRYLAAYWGEKNIRVNCISPGGVYHEGENETFIKKYSEKVPLGRKAEVNEVANALVFLASDDSSYITGQNIIVDGGWTAW
jgi:NAD(P)-dependent dehydrogenase (short-subunit alcohol dehydrogenase family)